MSKITNDRVLYSCTHMAAVGVKGLTFERTDGANGALLCVLLLTDVRPLRSAIVSKLLNITIRTI